MKTFFYIDRSKIYNRYDPAFYIRQNKLTDSISLYKVADVLGGKRIPKGMNYTDRPTDYLYLRVADIADNYIDYANLKHVDNKVYEILQRYEIFNNNIALSIAGTIGKVVYINDIPEDTHIILTENCAKLVVKRHQEILPLYLKIVLELDVVQQQIQDNYIQTTIPKLSLERIKHLSIPLPPDLQKQQEIIDKYMYAYHVKQQKEQEANALLASIDDYLLSELGIECPALVRTENGRFFYTSFKEIEGKRIDPYYNHPYFKKAYNSLHKTPYPVLRLGQLSTLIASGSTPPSGGEDYTTKENGIMFVRSGDITNDCNIIDSSDMLYITKECHNTKMRQSQLRYGDILIAIVGATIGAVNIYNYSAEANINQAIALVRLKSGINELFITEQLRSSIGRLNLEHQKRPVARANINLDEIAQMELILPPLEIQDKIAENIQSIRDQAKYLQQEAKEIINNAKQKIEQMILGK